MQETQVWSLIQEDHTCLGWTKPMHHNYWTCAQEPGSWTYRALQLQLLKPMCPRACAWHPMPVFLPGETHTEEPEGLQSMALQRVGQDWSDSMHTCVRSCVIEVSHLISISSSIKGTLQSLSLLASSYSYDSCMYWVLTGFKSKTPDPID